MTYEQWAQTENAYASPITKAFYNAVLKGENPPIYDDEAAEAYVSCKSAALVERNKAFIGRGVPQKACWQ